MYVLKEIRKLINENIIKLEMYSNFYNKRNKKKRYLKIISMIL